MQYILGVDTAWSINNPSGIALLSLSEQGNLELIRAGRSYEEFITGEIQWQQAVKGSKPDFAEIVSSCPHVDVIALDMPMSPFHIKGRREADNAISRKYGKQKASTHTPNEKMPGLLGLDIYKQLVQLGFTLCTENIKLPAFIEVYPHVTIIEVFGYSERFPYKVSKKAKYWPEASALERNLNILANLNELRKHLALRIDGVDRVLPQLELDKHYTGAFLKGYEDLLDALVSALSGYYFLMGKAIPYGDENGAVWVPLMVSEVESER